MTNAKVTLASVWHSTQRQRLSTRLSQNPSQPTVDDVIQNIIIWLSFAWLQGSDAIASKMEASDPCTGNISFEGMSNYLADGSTDLEMSHFHPLLINEYSCINVSSLYFWPLQNLLRIPFNHSKDEKAYNTVRSKQFVQFNFGTALLHTCTEAVWDTTGMLRQP